MKPDSFMPFYGNDFFLAVDAEDDSTGWYYLRALWYYWSNNHCEGLKNDDEFLRKVCRATNPATWAKAKPIIFGEFFRLEEDQLWHQGRADREWRRSKELYQRRCAQTFAATASRKKPTT